MNKVNPDSNALPPSKSTGRIGSGQTSRAGIVHLGCLLAIVVGIIWIILRAIKKNTDDKKRHPIVRRKAKILQKNVSQEAVFRSGTQSHHFITFEIADGNRLVFEVKETVYFGLTAGDTGTLITQRDEFEGFERNVPGT